jgi:hypothetical protein
VAHVCNPSYSGGRGQEDGGSKPAQSNSLQDPILKKPITKRADGVAQGIDPEFKPQDHQKKPHLVKDKDLMTSKVRKREQSMRYFKIHRSW